MAGMNLITGERLAGLAHLRQSIADILTTPIGTRVMRRNYGSLLFELIDQPDNGTTQVRLQEMGSGLTLRQFQTKENV